MRIAVLPNNVHAASSHDVRISLFEPAEGPAVGSVGTQVRQETIRTLGRTPAAKAWDLAALAMAVIAADRHVNRAAVSEDGWTRQIHLTVAVTNANQWARLSEHVERMLRFLTGDLWTLEFVPDGVHPAPPRQAVGGRPETCVSLLSGGLDSLIGAIDLNARGHLPMFVSNRVKGDCSKQSAFAAAVGAANRILSLNHNARTNVPNPEISQRPRSLAFLAFGVLAATTLDTYQTGSTIDLYVPENGFISLNVPLTPLRMGSLSTRTTHPRFVSEMQGLLDALGLRVRLVNPYRHKTKGEMMVECADQALLYQLAPGSMSCGRGGRINRHCGKCLPCLVRRAAFFRHAGTVQGDRTTPTYKNPDPSGAFHRPAFSRYDDVIQCLAAIDTMDRWGTRRWIGPAITAAKVRNPGPYRDVAVRGLIEIKEFLQAVGLG